MLKQVLVLLVAAAFVASASAAGCPFAHLHSSDGENNNPHDVSARHHQGPSYGVERLGDRAQPGYAEALAALDFDAVRADLRELFTTSQPDWPADFGNYGPFFVRLAWHNSGSYRVSDGRGGVDGARQRFDPERSWDDNTNLDKARNLLAPIKVKYGLGLSWGDLIVLAGNTAIESMGFPQPLGFCAGRIDAPDGTESLPLGPSEEQERVAPCVHNGDCDYPLGTTTVGLIYVNPQGPDANPVPKLSVPRIRSTFGRMGMDDLQTAALIGGGHAFGKAHGACPAGAGPSPHDDPENPWPGNCGSGADKGKGCNTFTSGIEGSWTPDPTTWSNSYYRLLVDHTFALHKGPGGAWQWYVNDTANGPTYASACNASVQEPIMMMTTDLALLEDPIYRQHVQKFASDQSALESAFAQAWYQLTTRDMGPATRCFGKATPPAEPFQHPLPPPPSPLANFSDVRAAIRELISQKPGTGQAAPTISQLARLAWRCAGTFRVTDYQGGCNGARVRLDPQRSWGINRGLDQPLALLSSVKQQFGDSLSWADLIVLAGNTALEMAGAPALPFCGGRSDAVSDGGSPFLVPLVDGSVTDQPITWQRDAMSLLGLSSRQFVALMGGLNSLQAQFMPIKQPATSNPAQLTNDFFMSLISNDWQKTTVNSQVLYKATNADIFTQQPNLALIWDAEYLALVQEFASSEDRFQSEFASVWTMIMNADRFDGPTGNVCM
eukprot:CAMPEP_0174236026 /NCGR_PEP_ID=MMETSP0417-20130205/5279_1 /TAXON_ID=242541 /ORGANISM="Mayorella sp, Strain BSH-02190019" /LENGTH=721 /DNA_ID=CAMNT_0015314613 /DNA_START=172 /DNA_END=2337 /DNA_ORIENTATION=+